MKSEAPRGPVSPTGRRLAHSRGLQKVRSQEWSWPVVFRKGSHSLRTPTRPRRRRSGRRSPEMQGAGPKTVFLQADLGVAKEPMLRARRGQTRRRRTSPSVPQLKDCRAAVQRQLPPSLPEEELPPLRCRSRWRCSWWHRQKKKAAAMAAAAIAASAARRRPPSRRSSSEGVKVMGEAVAGRQLWRPRWSQSRCAAQVSRLGLLRRGPWPPPATSSAAIEGRVAPTCPGAQPAAGQRASAHAPRAPSEVGRTRPSRYADDELPRLSTSRRLQRRLRCRRPCSWRRQRAGSDLDSTLRPRLSDGRGGGRGRGEARKVRGDSGGEEEGYAKVEAEQRAKDEEAVADRVGRPSGGEITASGGGFDLLRAGAAPPAAKQLGPARGPRTAVRALAFSYLLLAGCRNVLAHMRYYRSRTVHPGSLPCRRGVNRRIPSLTPHQKTSRRFASRVDQSYKRLVEELRNAPTTPSYGSSPAVPKFPSPSGQSQRRPPPL